MKQGFLDVSGLLFMVSGGLNQSGRLLVFSLRFYTNFALFAFLLTAKNTKNAEIENAKNDSSLGLNKKP